MAGYKNVLESVREDDFVEYYLFPKPSVLNDNKEEEIMISSVLREAKQIIKKFVNKYIWHRDEFVLSARTAISNILANEEDRELLPSHLYGITHYGDNIEDEWFIIYLLMQLTKEIDGLIVRVTDADGEFLLIEAADHLPPWARPENCEKRVYLYKGLIHILAPEEECAEEDYSDVQVANALKEIRNNPSLTVASPQIQQAILNKIKEYPEKILENLHRTNIYLPIGLAAILQHKPNLIAPAVLAFCNRDSVDLKACKAMKYFPPENRIYCNVTFTKCLYAMLTHSKYNPERKTGWNLVPVSDPKHKSQSLGVKVACGFEILISQAKPSKDIEGDKGWHNYLDNLQKKDYFRDLLEHSQEYNNLLNKAKEYYINNGDSMHYTPAVGQEILDLSKNLDYNLEDLKKLESKLPVDDDEEWLNISPEELDKMLLEQYGQKKALHVRSGEDASNFTQKINKFLNHISDVDGAEFPKEEIPIRPPRTKKVNDNKVNFDANSFSCAVQNILNFVIPEDDSWDLDSDSDMDDYGKEEEPPMDYGELKNKMQEYMKQMDQELSTTTIGKSFETKKVEDFEDIESFKPVDIDMNALKNILESYKSQMGEAGPSTNMLGPMGVHLEKAEQMNDSE
ncbi:PREDICTED: protein ecdysoneless [Nicrophorus vespilloides]|uniref:Protein ecdysoneless n=1 Tax=Nicrophorus vespilloides TaxID=110193 RepID=A0ABM1MV93_NICVS|nr:PREDICTED: protein ecdysoneless [Nicrophorus vespilloides]